MSDTPDTPRLEPHPVDGWYTVTDTYVAQDGEHVLLSVAVKPGDGWGPDRIVEEAQGYFREHGHRVVESAKRAGVWPLPADHPNAA
jgi:hypothetical protein